MVRYFKCYYGADCFGRFTGRFPKRAAYKGLSSILSKNIDYQDGQNIMFSMKEVTRGSKKKMFTYNGKREKLEHPVQIMIGDKVITYKYKKYVKATKLQQTEFLLNMIKQKDGEITELKKQLYQQQCIQ